jgi:glucosamine--fructose-6-phosphate aminotransferase (isomerizing)
MCGITACAGRGDVVEELLAGLQNLEYRGYDSSGIAVTDGEELTVCKREGEIERLVQSVGDVDPEGRVGVGHTRWSTHGAPTDANAHPHTDCTGRVAVVHNGIIENHAELRERLRDDGHRFESETDTEVVPHLVAEALSDGATPEEALRGAIDRLEGSFALAVVVAGDDTIYATRRGSPLVLGLSDDRNFLASDVPSFLEFTDRIVHLEDGDVVTVTADEYTVTDSDGRAVGRAPETVDWAPEDAARNGYDHYMLKEIHEQPSALERSLRGRVSGDEIRLESFPPGTFSDVSEVHLVAAGTSYHASLYARQLLVTHGIPAQAFSAGEYATTPAPLSEDTLVVAVTQSGETADTLASLRHADRAGARTLALTNVVGSTAARECDDQLYIRAGPEIGVAATKTFSSQVATLSLLVERLVEDMHGEPSENCADMLQALTRLPEKVRLLLDRTSVATLVDRYANRRAYFFIGRGLAFPVALEGALKFKEITYEHAEGFAAAELKHGPLALVTPETPVVAVFTGEHVEKTLNNVQEVRARGAPVIGIGGADLDGVADNVDEFVPVPPTHWTVSGLLANVQLQLISYHVADILGRNIDKPRNLAKSVTVE